MRTFLLLALLGCSENDDRIDKIESRLAELELQRGTAAAALSAKPDGPKKEWWCDVSINGLGGRCASSLKECRVVAAAGGHVCFRSDEPFCTADKLQCFWSAMECERSNRRASGGCVQIEKPSE